MTTKQAPATAEARLRELMSTEVVTRSPEDTLRRAVEVLAGRGISGVPVLAGGTVVGVLSATDLLEVESSTPGVPAERPDQAERGEWGPAPEWVEGEEPPAGYFLELWRDADAAVDARFRGVSGPEWDVLEEHTVAEAMSRRLCGLPPEATLRDAAAFVLRARIHRVLVMDGERLYGVVSTTDVLRGVTAETNG